MKGRRFRACPSRAYPGIVAYDRDDAREQRRNELAKRLADARRRAGMRARGDWSAASPAIVLSVLLVLIAPDLVTNVARGRCSDVVGTLEGLAHDALGALDGAREGVAAQLRSADVTRPWLNRPPVAALAADAHVTGPTEIVLPGWDADEGDRLEVRIEQLPRRGTVEVLDPTVPARVRYTPTFGSTGPDTFSYAVCDGLACSAPRTRRVEIDTRMPLASSSVARTASSSDDDACGAPPIALGAPAQMGEALMRTQVTVEYLRHQTAVLDGQEPVEAAGGAP